MNIYLKKIKLLSLSSKYDNTKKYNTIEYLKLNSREIQILCPWGHISGKWWGSLDNKPILCLHGGQDSCGSYDRLMSFLTKKFSYLAIDLPGQGYSSNIPNGINYNVMDFTSVIDLVKDYYKFDKVPLMGHSMGSTINFLYTAANPQKVDFLICLNGPFLFDVKNYLKDTIRNITLFEKYSKFERSDLDKPLYTLDETVEKLYRVYGKTTVEFENARLLVQRNLQPSQKGDGKFQISLDQRLKIRHKMYLTPEQLPGYVSKISCPTLLLKAAEETDEMLKSFNAVAEILGKEPGRGHEIHKLSEGHHHVHIINPHIVANVLNKFLEKRFLDLNDNF